MIAGLVTSKFLSTLAFLWGIFGSHGGAHSTSATIARMPDHIKFDEVGRVITHDTAFTGGSGPNLGGGIKPNSGPHMNIVC